MRFDFSANAFLHHMVRNIVGALVYVGAGRQPPAWIARAARGARPHARRADVRRRTASTSPAPTTTRASACRRRVRARQPLAHEATCARASRSAASRASPTALAAARAGADAIGLVFWRGTPRFVEVGRAREIADALPPFVTDGRPVRRSRAGRRARGARRRAARRAAVPRRRDAGPLPRASAAPTSRRSP